MFGLLISEESSEDSNRRRSRMGSLFQTQSRSGRDAIPDRPGCYRVARQECSLSKQDRTKISPSTKVGKKNYFRDFLQ